MATYPTSPGALRVASVVQDQRRATDKLFQFTPLPKQLPFIRAVLTDEPPWEQWFLAANRAGKIGGRGLLRRHAGPLRPG